MRKKNLIFMCLPGLDTFLKDIMEDLKEDYNVKLSTANEEIQIRSDIDWADIVWLEWANELAIGLTNSDILDNKHVILRVHSYEVLSGYIPKIRWEKVNTVIAVADHIKDQIIRQLEIKEQQEKSTIVKPEIQVIPNGVDLDKFKFNDKKGQPHKKVAFLGAINNKKGIMLMLHAFNELYTMDPSYTLHIAGAIQEARYGYYINHIIGKFGWPEPTMLYYNHIRDVSTWLQDKDYVICTSPWESQNMGIMEGMACGCKPVIHHFIGAEKIYRPVDLWVTIDEFVQKIRSKTFTPKKYREYIQKNYDLKMTMKQIRNVLSRSGELKITTAANFMDKEYILKQKLGAEEKKSNVVQMPTNDYQEDVYWNKRAFPTDPTMLPEKTQEHIEYIRKQLKSMDERILDFGPGIGRTFEAYKSVYSVDAVDVSMIYTDRVKAEAAKYDFNFNLQYTTVKKIQEEGLPFGDKVFDVAVASEVFLHQRPEHIIKIMTELARVAKKVVVISWMVQEAKIPYMELGQEVHGRNHCFHYHYPALCEALGMSINNEVYTENQIYFTYKEK